MISKKGPIKKLALKYDLALVVLFGSQVTGKTHKESDYDIAYLSSGKKINLEEEIKINNELIEIFKHNAIQLVNLKNVSPLLGKKIVEHAIVLYEKERHLFDTFFISALRLYDEARPLFDLRSHYVSNIIEEYKNA